MKKSPPDCALRRKSTCTAAAFVLLASLAWAGCAGGDAGDSTDGVPADAQAPLPDADAGTVDWTLACPAGSGSPGAEDTSSFVAASCDRTWTSAVLPADDRPSTLKTCYTDELGHEPCLPWETCVLDNKGTEVPIPVGPGLCYRGCGPDKARAPGNACMDLPVYDMDVSYTIPVCPGAQPPSPWPAYPDRGPNPAEGGIDCWTAVADTPGQNGRAWIEVVGGHVYVLTGKLGVSAATGELVSSTRLVTTPLAAGSEPRTLHDGAGEPFLWSRPRRSGDHLVILERDTPTGQPWDEGPVPTRLLYGIPDADGTVDLVDSGQAITLEDDLGAPVVGTRHGCLVRQAADDLELVCFPVANGALIPKTSLLSIPKRAREDFAASRAARRVAPVPLRAWSMAASERWLAFFSGTSCAAPATWSLHVAPFDAEADAVAGPWRTTAATPSSPCLGGGVVTVVGDVLTATGATTRLSACAPTEWLAGTLRERALGSPIGWTVYGDVLVLFDLLAVSGPDPPGRVLATRVLW